MVEPLDLDAIKARLAATKAGPWFYNSYCLVASVPLTRAEGNIELDHKRAGSPWVDGDYPEPWASRAKEVESTICEVPPSYGDTATGVNAADADFIAHSHTDVTALIAEVERLRALVDDRTT